MVPMNAEDKIKMIEERIISLLHEIDREKGISKTMHYDTLLTVYLEKRQQLKDELEK
jgi:hypothetical protein